MAICGSCNTRPQRLRDDPNYIKNEEPMGLLSRYNAVSASQVLKSEINPPY